MKLKINQLHSIQKSLDNLHDEMERDARIWADELADRQRLGLTGDDAVRHYHEWMARPKKIKPRFRG